MNISQKCSCCIKENVCKYSVDYQFDCSSLKNNIKGSTTELSIKCSEFYPKQTTNIRGVENER